MESVQGIQTQALYLFEGAANLEIEGVFVSRIIAKMAESAMPKISQMPGMSDDLRLENALLANMEGQAIIAIAKAAGIEMDSAEAWQAKPPLASSASTAAAWRPSVSRQFATLAKLGRNIVGQTRIVWGLSSPPPWDIIIPPLQPGEPPVQQPDGSWIVPIRKVYVMLHDISLVRLPDRTNIDTAEMQISLDADSRDIQFRARILGQSALDAVVPASDGTPVVVEANIDGYRWQFMVEDWERELQSRKRGRALTGRSLSARLDRPFQIQTSRISADAATAQQLAVAEINNPANALPLSGVTMTWATDWLVPAGAWSLQNATPAQAIASLAAAAGMVAVPGAVSASLAVQPRYPVMPWNFATSTPYLVIPQDACTNIKERYSIPTQGNAVFIHGGNLGGILARVYRAGTAGDRVLPTVQNDLITHTDAAFALGSRILAGQQQQPRIASLTCPFDNNLFPLGEIGKLVKVQMDYGNVFGIVNGYSVSATPRKVRQTLTLGESTQNVWTELSKLLPQEPLLVGTVSAVSGDTVTVDLVGQGTVRVRGTAQTGDKVFVRYGKIDSIAPNLGLMGDFEV